METRSSLTPGTTLPNLGMPGPAGPALLAGRRRGVGGEPPFSQQEPSDGREKGGSARVRHFEHTPRCQAF